MDSLPFPRPVRILFALSMILLSCCEDTQESEQPAPCTTKEDSRNASINAFDRNPNSPYFGKVVAVFQFKQQSATYSGLGCNGKLMECSNTLVVRNVTNRTISFDFNVKYFLNAVAWNYQNFAAIPPNSAHEFGAINSNCASISLGIIQLEGSAINYQ